MSRHAHEPNVVDALTRPPADPASLEPPADLAERIKADVPPTLELVPALAESSRGFGRRRVWLAAASVVLAVGAGVVALQVRDRTEGEAAARGAVGALASPEPDGAARSGRLDVESAPIASEPMETKDQESTQAGGAEQATEVRRAEQAGAATPSKPGPARQRTEQEAEARVEMITKRTASNAPSEATGDAAKQGAVNDVITVTSEAPLLDERKTAAGTVVSQQELERVPTARDPWATATQSPGVVTDRASVGGAKPGGQDAHEAFEKSSDPDTYSVDGVRITDMAAIGTSKGEGSSPTYYEFQQNEEIQVGPTPKAKLVPPADAVYSIPGAPAGTAPSTGGTAEPNDQPYGDVFFRGYGTNPFIDSEDDRFSTFGLDVDTGSWGVVRRYLRDGNLPPREAVRVEELINAFDYDDPAPRRGDFRVVADGAATPFAGRRDNPRYRVLRFGLHAREVDVTHRKPAVLTFVVDVSGSMAAENRLGLVRKSLSLLLDQLRPDDRVALVVYGSFGHVVLEPTGDLEAIRSAIGRLVPEGATNAEEGLVLAYDVARRAFRPGAINRVILCSDGVANVGRTGPESILGRIGDAARDGIELTTVGFGMGNYNDTLMEQLADRGDGMYAYVDDLDEARRVFVENLTGTLQTVARDAKVQVEVDPQVIARYRLLGYENRDVPDEKFRDDTVDAGEVGAGHTVTALYEVKLRDGIDPRRDRGRTAATLHLRWQSVATGKVEEMALPVAVGDLAGGWSEAPPSLRLASVVAELAEALKGTYWARETDLDELFRRAQKVSADFPGRLDVAELVTTIGRAARLADRARQGAEPPPEQDSGPGGEAPRR